MKIQLDLPIIDEENALVRNTTSEVITNIKGEQEVKVTELDSILEVYKILVIALQRAEKEKTLDQEFERFTNHKWY